MFLRRYLPMILVVFALLVVGVVLWIFSAPIAQWSRSAQPSDAVGFLGEHLLAVAMLGGCLLVLALIWLPKWQATRPDLTTKERLELENDARKTLAEIVGGAALLVGLYFTWANLQITQETATKDRETIREGQITERFTKAIDQLGNEISGGPSRWNLCPGADCQGLGTRPLADYGSPDGLRSGNCTPATGATTGRAPLEGRSISSGRTANHTKPTTSQACC